jgi:MFS family permease
MNHTPSSVDGNRLPPLTRTQWLICVLAAIGFMFDIYELLMGQFIVRDAIQELGGHKPGSPEFKSWASRFIVIPMVIGGVFGLLGGWLTDRLGRRRVLTWSILLYAFSALAAGFATSLPQLMFFRTLTIIGVCVEFVAAVAWLAEIFTDPHRREKVLGYTQAFSSFGGFLVAAVYGWCASHHDSLPRLGDLFGSIKDPQAAWRYLLISGVVPALPLIIIRPFLPESPLWLEKKKSGTLRRPSLGELFSPGLIKTTMITTLSFACAYGIAFGAIQQMAQIVPGHPAVRAEVQSVQEKMNPETKQPLTPPEKMALKGKTERTWASKLGTIQETGGLIGRFILAVLAVRILSRQRLLRCFQWPALVLVPLLFAWGTTQPVWLWGLLTGLVGMVIVGQYSFWGNYLPQAFPLHLRGTGEGFAANIGGRVLGTLFFSVTQSLAVTNDPALASGKLSQSAAWVGGGLALAGLVLSFFLPEPKPESESES